MQTMKIAEQVKWAEEGISWDGLSYAAGTNKIQIQWLETNKVYFLLVDIS